MTVNELIDKLESVSIRLLGKETEQADRAIILYRESAIMLRQQQDEIETLKSEIIMQNERWKKIHPKESELEMKYSDEWWKGIALLNKTFPFKLGRK
jgi:hypothetical protein